MALRISTRMITSAEILAYSTIVVDEEGAEQVLDRYGKPLIAARKYYIVPGIFGPTGGGVGLGLPLEIASEEKPQCATSSNWVAVVDDFPLKWVGIGGAKDHPGKKIITGSFNIQAFDASYKLLFCPTMSASASTCFDIGRYDDVGGRRLVLTKDHPYQVGFIVADATRSSID
ncbi:subtilisin inhibitor CLSI-II [Cajanus cajan]|uniref:subtilisin inhibitor CLSI-II n=1 Tax=Cajanus cajan TaxID=3821 RepID=UPI00098D8241|nr:subtilisin inhibitor CLSI-II [Cajanus cajan]